MSENGRSITKVATRMKLGEQASDLEYWLAQPFEARIAALEELRRQYAVWKYGSVPGFQRVYRVIKRS